MNRDIISHFQIPRTELKVQSTLVNSHYRGNGRWLPDKSWFNRGFLRNKHGGTSIYLNTNMLYTIWNHVKITIKVCFNIYISGYFVTPTFIAFTKTKSSNTCITFWVTTTGRQKGCPRPVNGDGRQKRNFYLQYFTDSNFGTSTTGR